MTLRIPPLTLIAAMDKNRVIGRDGQLPWSLPDDLKHFKTRTMGKTMVMGRRTWESIGARPLKGRRNVVLSRDSSFQAPGAELFSSLVSVLKEFQTEPELLIIGGATLYQATIHLATTLELTLVDARLQGTTYFPSSMGGTWEELSRIHHPKDERHAFSFDFVTFRRADVVS
jgi:dihydrofolate reductase